MGLGIFKGNAQILKPVKWSYSFIKLNAKTGFLVLTASIQKGWHIYAQGPDNGDGPIPTSFKFEKSNLYAAEGNPVPSILPKTSFDPTFKKNIGVHEGTIQFKEKINLHGPVKSIKGSLEFMVCNDKQCLPPQDLDFEVKVN